MFNENDDDDAEERMGQRERPVSHLGFLGLQNMFDRSFAGNFNGRAVIDDEAEKTQLRRLMTRWRYYTDSRGKRRRKITRVFATKEAMIAFGDRLRPWVVLEQKRAAFIFLLQLARVTHNRKKRALYLMLRVTKMRSVLFRWCNVRLFDALHRLRRRSKWHLVPQLFRRHGLKRGMKRLFRRANSRRVQARATNVVSEACVVTSGRSFRSACRERLLARLLLFARLSHLTDCAMYHWESIARRRALRRGVWHAAISLALRQRYETMGSIQTEGAWVRRRVKSVLCRMQQDVHMTQRQGRILRAVLVKRRHRVGARLLSLWQTRVLQVKDHYMDDQRARCHHTKGLGRKGFTRLATYLAQTETRLVWSRVAHQLLQTRLKQRGLNGFRDMWARRRRDRFWGWEAQSLGQSRPHSHPHMDSAGPSGQRRGDELFSLSRSSLAAVSVTPRYDPSSPTTHGGEDDQKEENIWDVGMASPASLPDFSLQEPVEDRYTSWGTVQVPEHAFIGSPLMPSTSSVTSADGEPLTSHHRTTPGPLRVRLKTHLLARAGKTLHHQLAESVGSAKSTGSTGCACEDWSRRMMTKVLTTLRERCVRRAKWLEAGCRYRRRSAYVILLDWATRVGVILSNRTSEDEDEEKKGGDDRGSRLHSTRSVYTPRIRRRDAAAAIDLAACFHTETFLRRWHSRVAEYQRQKQRHDEGLALWRKTTPRRLLTRWKRTWWTAVPPSRVAAVQGVCWYGVARRGLHALRRATTLLRASRLTVALGNTRAETMRLIGGWTTLRRTWHRTRGLRFRLRGFAAIRGRSCRLRQTMHRVWSAWAVVFTPEARRLRTAHAYVVYVRDRRRVQMFMHVWAEAWTRASQRHLHLRRALHHIRFLASCTHDQWEVVTANATAGRAAKPHIGCRLHRIATRSRSARGLARLAVAARVLYTLRRFASRQRYMRRFSQGCSSSSPTSLSEVSSLPSPSPSPSPLLSLSLPSCSPAPIAVPPLSAPAAPLQHQGIRPRSSPQLPLLPVEAFLNRGEYQGDGEGEAMQSLGAPSLPTTASLVPLTTPPSSWPPTAVDLVSFHAKLPPSSTFMETSHPPPPPLPFPPHSPLSPRFGETSPDDKNNTIEEENGHGSDHDVVDKEDALDLRHDERDSVDGCRQVHAPSHVKFFGDGNLSPISVLTDAHVLNSNRNTPFMVGLGDAHTRLHTTHTPVTQENVIPLQLRQDMQIAPRLRPPHILTTASTGPRAPSIHQHQRRRNSYASTFHQQQIQRRHALARGQAVIVPAKHGVADVALLTVREAQGSGSMVHRSYAVAHERVVRTGMRPKDFL